MDLINLMIYFRIKKKKNKLTDYFSVMYRDLCIKKCLI